MKFLTLDIENFLAITKAHINLADRGLVVIQGINSDDTSADSNGAGKSTIADAISWVLYGETARGDSGDDVINFSAGKGTRVVVKVVDDTITYTISRHRKHKTGKNQLQVVADDGLKVTELTKGTEKLTQDVVTKIIGSSIDVFNSAVYAGQERMPDLPKMTDKQIKLLVEEAAGVTVLEGAYEFARKDFNACEARVGTLYVDRTTLEGRILWLDSQGATASARAEAWIKDRDATVQLLRSEVASLVPEIKSMNAALLPDPTALGKEIAQCDQQIAAVAGENAGLHKLDRALSEASSAARYAQQQKQLASNILGNRRDDLAAVNHKLGCPCDECGRPMTEAELGAATKVAQDRVRDQTDALQRATDAEVAAVSALDAAQKAKDAYAAGMTDLGAVIARRASIQAQLDADRTARGSRDRKLVEAKAKKAQLDGLALEANPHDAAVEAVKIEQLKATDDLEALKLRIVEAEKELLLEKENVKLFSPAGVRAHILDDVTPFLNQQTSKYLATLSDGNISANWTTLVTTQKGELREKFSIEVENDKGGKKFSSISGGEKRKVRIATALALQDLVATRATKPIDLFIGDEIDDALDPAGLERLTQILEEKARERGSVFVISHHSLRDWISNVIQIEKRPGGETVVTEMTL